MRKRLVDSYTDPGTGVRYGLRGDPLDFQFAQQYTSDHVSAFARDFLMKGAPAVICYGFDATLAGALAVSIASGEAFDADGHRYETITDPTGQPTVVMHDAAHATLPRIDVIYAQLEANVPALPVPRTFRRLLSTAELAAHVAPYTPENFTRFPEEHTRATILVRKGTAASSPVAPAVSAGEVALFEVRINANAATLINANVTDRRVHVRSLQDALGLIDALNGSAIIATTDEKIQDVVGAMLAVTPNTGLAAAYNDLGNSYGLAGVAATGTAMGMMSAADKTKLDTTTAAATASAIAQRDSGGAAAFTKIATTGRSTAGSPASARAVFLDAEDASAAPTTPQMSLYRGNANEANPYVLQLSANANSSTAGDQAGVLDIVDTNPGAPGAYATGAHNLLTVRGTNHNGQAMAFKVRSSGEAYHSETVTMASNLAVNGAISKGSGTFLIDHPLNPSNKDLYHGFVESNEYLLFYRGGATLVGGSKEVDVDAALGLTAGTFARIAADIEVFGVNSAGSAKVTASAVNINAPVGGIAHTVFTLTSASGTDTSAVRFLIVARRNDAFIQTLENTDNQGKLTPEVNKVAPTTEQLALLTGVTKTVPSGSPLAGTTQNQVVMELIGMQGYPRHPELVSGASLPTQVVTYQTA